MAKINPAVLAEDNTVVSDVEPAIEHERGEAEAKTILAAWKGNDVTALLRAATEYGLLVNRSKLAYGRAWHLLSANMELKRCDPKNYGVARKTFDAATEAFGVVSLPANDNSQANARFDIIWFDDVDQTAAKEEIVEGVLGAGEFTLWVAKPGTGKSVLVGDIGLHIAAGIDWHGRKVQPGLVVFFAAERKRLTERRVAAWRKRHGYKNLPFVVVGGKLDLTTGLADAKALAKTISELESKSGKPCVLVILDTVSRTFGPGDQNQSRDMIRYVQSVDELSRSIKAHVVAIHHSTWAESRGKGAIDLDGAVDASFEVTVSGTGPSKVFTLKCTGANDGDEGIITSFKLEGVPLGLDSRGNETSAPIVVPVDILPEYDVGTLKGNTKTAFAAFEAALAEKGEPPPNGVAEGIERVLSRANWRERYFAEQKASKPDTSENALNQSFGRAVQALSGRTLGQTNEWFWLL